MLPRLILPIALALAGAIAVGLVFAFGRGPGSGPSISEPSARPTPYKVIYRTAVPGHPLSAYMEVCTLYATGRSCIIGN